MSTTRRCSLDKSPQTSQNNQYVTVLTLCVCDCPSGHTHDPPTHPQYTRATISSILTLAGLKPRHAYRVRDSVFATLAAAVRAHPTPLHEVARQDAVMVDGHSKPAPPDGSPALVDAVELPNGQWRVVVARQELERMMLHLLDVGDVGDPAQRDPAAVLFGGVETLRAACR